jgi:hypothetical protein
MPPPVVSVTASIVACEKAVLAVVVQQRIDLGLDHDRRVGLADPEDQLLFEIFVSFRLLPANSIERMRGRSTTWMTRIHLIAALESGRSTGLEQPEREQLAEPAPHRVARNAEPGGTSNVRRMRVLSVSVLPSTVMVPKRLGAPEPARERRTRRRDAAAGRRVAGAAAPRCRRGR